MLSHRKVHYIFYIDGSSYKSMYEAMLGDLIDNPEVTLVWDNAKISIKKELLLKRKVQWLTKGYLDVFGYEENNLYEVIKANSTKNDMVYVIFFNGALHHNPYLAGTLRRYKREFKNIKYVLYYTDIINCAVSKNAYYLQMKKIFDLVYTVDAADAAKYGMKLWPTLYSRAKDYGDVHTKFDMYFCGVSKGRSSILLDCLSKSTDNAINTKMDVICYDDADAYQGYDELLTIRSPKQHLMYSSVLEHELEANCILEVVQKGQVALTLRAYEAVVYNKKLLTNNKTIFTFKYYNPLYMKYFENVEAIDWEWVGRREKVEYCYDNSFSPSWLIEDIDKSCSC